ncbi:MAG: hypothetical protein C4523_05545 [Myxococcales bacterium]|nr:MAG: hypothetical protein C4523_05545 [Myxococcales bacterium]
MTEYLYYLIAFACGAATVLGVWALRRTLHRGRAGDPEEVRRLLLHGAYQILNGDLRKAAEAYTTIIQEHQGQEEVYFVLGRLLRQLGEVERAARLHQSLALHHETRDPKLKLAAALELAEDYRVAERPDLALDVLDDLILHLPREPEPAERLAMLAIQEGKWETAVKALARLERLVGRRFDSLMGHLLACRALELIEAGDLKLVKGVAKAAVKRAPGGGHAHFALARAFEALGNPRRAFRALYDGAKAQPAAAMVLLPELRRLAGENGWLGEYDEILSDCLNYAMPLPEIARAEQAIRLESEGQAEEARNMVRPLLARGCRLPPVLAVAQGLDLTNSTPEAAPYECAVCGAARDDFSWHCAECGGWDTFLPPVEAAARDVTEPWT